MTFEEWRKKAKTEIEIVGTLMKEEMSDDLEILSAQLKDIEVWNFRLIKLYCEAEYYLDSARATNLIEKSKEFTDLDREIKLDDATKVESSIFKLLQFLVGTRRSEGILSKRISLGQSFLAGHRSVYKNIRSQEDGKNRV